jgi:Bacterial Ig-like domain (group 3)
MGGVGGASATSLALCTTTTSAPVATPTSAKAGVTITYTATVTASAGCANGFPTGTVGFYSNYGSASSFLVGQAVSLKSTSTPGVSLATLTDNSLPAGSYAITASYTSDSPSLFYDSSSASSTPVTIQSAAPNQTKMNFTLSPSTITAGQNVTFNVTVTAVDANGNPLSGVVPTGSVSLSAGPTASDGQQHFATVDLQNGSLTFTYNGFVAGDYIVIASYPGDPTDQSISGQLPLTVNPAAGSIATTTTVSANPSSISTGSTTTLTAHVAENGTNAAPPDGGEVDFFAGPNATSLQSEGSGTLSGGTASVTIGNFTAGSYVVRAQYAGDTTNKILSSYGDNTLTVTSSGGGSGGATATATAYTGPTEAAAGATVTLTGKLTENGVALSGEQLTLSLGSQSCVTTTPTSGSGTASCQITLSQSPGQYPVTASFGGDSNWSSSSSDPQTFTVDGVSTSLQYNGATSAAYGASAELSATLTSGGSALSGETVVLSMGSQTCTDTTDNSGNAACSITVNQAPGSYTAGGDFAGDGNYNGSSDSAAFTVTSVSTTTTYTGDTQGAPNGTATLSAKLVDANGAAIPGEPVALSMGSQQCATTPTTDSNGVASCQITITQPAGSYPIVASFAGDGGYLSSSDTSRTFTVSSNTAVHVTALGPVALGGTVSLSGTLLAGSTPVAGKALTLSLGSQSCSATTNASGVATCSVTASGPLGPTNVKAAYGSLSDTKSTIVFAYAPGGGSFVVGDKSDSGTVTFWGAQWSKVNVLSGSPAPSSFKGWADNPSVPQCGTNWSTSPGNSSSPPNGPLPSYMAVVVTSSAAQSGSSIAGNTVAIVIVQVAAGYKSDPGHAGTGTVVATLCQSTTNGGNGNGHGGGKKVSCGGSFNGNSIHGGNTLWFNSSLNVHGLPWNGATLSITGQTITIGGQTINVPDGKIVFSPTARTATTTFTNGVWVTVVPVNQAGNVFLSGIGYQLPGSGLRGGQNATWSGTISSDTPGVSVNWQWGAAAYTSFGSNLGGLGVKPVDDNQSSSWHNSDHAGAPESWSRGVTGGGTGGGGSDYTGSTGGNCSVGF